MKVRGNLEVAGSLIFTEEEDGTVGSVQIDTAHIREEQAFGVDGQGLSLGWTTRILNTVVSNTITGCSLASNKITLPAGRYYIKAVAPAFTDQRTEMRCRLFNFTDSVTLIIGQSMMSFDLSGAGVPASTTLISVEGFITLSGTKQIELHHYINSSTDGGEKTSVVGFNEVYAEVIIWRI